MHEYQVLPTFGGNVVKRGKYGGWDVFEADRIHLDKTATIWNITSDEQFDALVSFAPTKDGFTFGGLKFNSNGQYAYTKGFECALRLYLWDNTFAPNNIICNDTVVYVINFRMIKKASNLPEKILIPPPAKSPIIERLDTKSWTLKSMDLQLNIYCAPIIYQMQKITTHSPLLMANDRFYCNDTERVHIGANYAPVDFKLPNYTAIVRTEPDRHTIQEIWYIFKVDSDELFSSDHPLDSFDHSIHKIVVYNNRRGVVLFNISTGKQICSMLEHATPTLMLSHYGFKKTKPPAPPIEIRTEDSIILPCNSLMKRDNLYVAKKSNNMLVWGYEYNPTSNTKTKPALHN